MTRFRLRPAEINAVRWRGDNWDEIVEAYGFQPDKVVHDPDSHALLIVTSNGRARCAAGDWLTHDQRGDFRPYSDAEFQNAYEPTATAVAERIGD